MKINYFREVTDPILKEPCNHCRFGAMEPHERDCPCLDCLHYE